MKKVEIQEAILVALDKTQNNDMNQHAGQNTSNTLNFINIKTINCVTDETRGNVIDLETGSVYHIIQRDGWGIISQEEAKFIKGCEEDTLFVYKYYKKNMEKISMLYQLFLNSRAQAKYQEYLQNIENKENQKVKTFNKPIEKTGK